jgi:hypothetical protein
MVDTEFVIMCDAGTGDPVILCYQTTLSGPPINNGEPVLLNLDGTPYAGTINDVVPCTDVTDYSFEYPICDNGIQKIVQVSFDGTTQTAVSFLNIDRTPAAAPANYDLVRYGSCPVSVLRTEAVGPLPDTFNPPLNEVYIEVGGDFEYQLAQDAGLTIINVPDYTRFVGDIIQIGAGTTATGITGFRYF